LVTLKDVWSGFLLDLLTHLKDISLLDLSYLLATCQTSQGTYYLSAVNLDELVVNINGQLQVKKVTNTIDFDY